MLLTYDVEGISLSDDPVCSWFSSSERDVQAGLRHERGILEA